MPKQRLPLRLILFAVLAIGAALLLGLVVATLNNVLEFYQRLVELPLWLRLPLLATAALVVAAIAWLLWRLARPARTTSAPAPVAITRPQIEARIDHLRERKAETATLEAELAELDRRHASGELYVALFSEISTGKSSLIRALAPEAAPEIDARGGTTRHVGHHRGVLADGRELVLADVPGSGEVDGSVREQLARDEALRAHAVVYVAASDLTRAQDAELGWLASFGKPLLLVLNKADQFRDGEREALQRALRERYADITAARVVVSAGGRESFERLLPDGRREQVQRERAPDIAALREVLARYAAHGAGALEPAREAAVLSALATRADTLEGEARERAAETVVTKYTKRAVVGALAAVMPGTDLIIQGVLGTALIRELGKLYDVPLRDIDIDAFLAQVKLTLRTSASLVLAIAGNALKAFPGLGTLGGGVLHAIAYGLIFDSLGRAVAQTLREQRALDGAAANETLATLLANGSAERLRRIAGYALKPNDDETH